jgi:hypothetical protein
MKLKPGKRLGKKPVESQEFSDRSKQSRKLEHERNLTIDKFGGLLKASRIDLAKEKQNHARWANMLASGQAYYVRHLHDSVAEIKKHEAIIASYEGAIADLEVANKALYPSAAQLAERHRKQARLAKLAIEREEHDGKIDLAITHLIGLLAERRQMTGEIIGLADEIDYSERNFDTERFDHLECALPLRMRDESAQWVNSLLGNDLTNSHLVDEECQSFTETLRHSGFYLRGETARLNDADFRRANTPKPRELTIAEFEAIMNPGGDRRREGMFTLGDPNFRLPGSSF